MDETDRSVRLINSGLYNMTNEKDNDIYDLAGKEHVK